MIKFITKLYVPLCSYTFLDVRLRSVTTFIDVPHHVCILGQSQHNREEKSIDERGTFIIVKHDFTC